MIVGKIQAVIIRQIRSQPLSCSVQETILEVPSKEVTQQYGFEERILLRFH